MAGLNRRSGPPERTIQYWVGAVGANQSLVETTAGLAARAVVVGVVAGSLVLVDISGTSRTFTAAEIVAQNNVLRGQWIQATAAGSAAHTLTAWW